MYESWSAAVTNDENPSFGSQIPQKCSKNAIEMYIEYLRNVLRMPQKCSKNIVNQENEKPSHTAGPDNWRKRVHRQYYNSEIEIFGLIKNHRVLERTVMESVATGSQRGDPSAGTREQDTEDTLGMRGHDTG